VAALISIPFGGGLVLLDEALNSLAVLNPGGAAIFTLLEAGFTDAEAAVAIAEQFGISLAQADIDVAALHAALAQRPAPDAASVLDPALDAPDDGDRSFHFEIQTLRLRFRSADRETRQRVAAILSPWAARAGEASLTLEVETEPSEPLILLRDGQPHLTFNEPSEAIGAIFQLVLEALNPGIEWLGLIHGGAVTLNGVPILLPGASGSGKSTLCAYLAANGFGYVSDDLIPLRADGRLVPWPTPFSIKRGSWALLKPWYPELAALPEQRLLQRALKLVPAPAEAWRRVPAPAKLMVFPKWSELEPAATLTPLPPLAALTRLAQERIWIGYPLSEAKLRRFLDWLGAIPAFELRYNALADAKALLEQAVPV
jgi:hypothetical protein